jgi:nucleoside-diphosphate-sugar epimerase
MNKVLITGATGFIGSHCLIPLLTRNFEIHAVSSMPHNDASTPVIWHQSNLLDLEKISKLIATVKPTHLLHLAWYVTPAKASGAIESFSWVQASLELLKQFHYHGGERVVFVGSEYEYDLNYGYCSESLTPKNPSTFYGICKSSLCLLFEAYSHKTGLSSAWARFFSPYGPNEHIQRLVPTVIRSLLKREPARCSHGKQIRDFLYVQDGAEGLVTLLDSPISGQINIASGQPTTLRTVIAEIARQLDGENLVLLGAIPPLPSDTPLVVADIRRLNNELGWQPKFSLEAGLEKTIEWWKQHLED